MKRVFKLSVVLLFFSSISLHGMELLRVAISFFIEQEPEVEYPQLQDPAQILGADIRKAFAQANLRAKNLALILAYYSDELPEREWNLLGKITLPDVRNKKRDFKYPKHSAVKISLRNNILTVLTTANEYLKYRLPEGMLISRESANLTPAGMHTFPVDGSIYVADYLIQSRTGNAMYSAEVDNPIFFLKNERKGWQNGCIVIRKWYEPLSQAQWYDCRGYCYYDNENPQVEGEQPGTIITIREASSVTLARILKNDLAEQEELSVQENKEEAPDFGGY